MYTPDFQTEHADLIYSQRVINYIQASFQGEELFSKGLAHLNIPLDTRRSDAGQKS
jgi:hypothetical protein